MLRAVPITWQVPKKAVALIRTRAASTAAANAWPRHSGNWAPLSRKMLENDWPAYFVNLVFHRRITFSNTVNMFSWKL